MWHRWRAGSPFRLEALDRLHEAGIALRDQFGDRQAEILFRQPVLRHQVGQGLAHGLDVRFELLDARLAKGGKLWGGTCRSEVVLFAARQGLLAMITDIFALRYEGVLSFDLVSAHGVTATLVQAAHIFFDDVRPKLGLRDDFFSDVHRQLARELGSVKLWDAPEQSGCADYLTRRYDLLSHDTPDQFCKSRLSLVELLFHKADEYVRTKFPSSMGRGVVPNAVEELNTRLQQNRTGLVYNNGLLHIASDELTTGRIAKPFWEIVANPKWATVDQEMKEAFDRLDHGQDDAFTHAIDALESAIKIISDDKGWTTRTEKGAVAYITNLRTGGFLEKWEVEPLSVIFTKLRNLHRHGGGSNPPDPLSKAQQTWAIESCMSWIKSLVWRMP